MNALTVLINNEPVFEFNREVVLEDDQLAFFDKMDSDMKSGIKIRGELIQQPDDHQRAIFVAMNLIKAIQQGNESVINSTCAYLVIRNPVLIEVRASDHANSVKIDLVEVHA